MIFYSDCFRVQEVHYSKAPSHPPLLRVQPVRPQDGPPLPLAQQLRRPRQPQALLPIHGLHRRRMPVHHGVWISGTMKPVFYWMGARHCPGKYECQGAFPLSDFNSSNLDRRNL
jgi:hypothetical protein